MTCSERNPLAFPVERGGIDSENFRGRFERAGGCDEPADVLGFNFIKGKMSAEPDFCCRLDALRKVAGLDDLSIG